MNVGMRLKMQFWGGHVCICFFFFIRAYMGYFFSFFLQNKVKNYKIEFELRSSCMFEQHFINPLQEFGATF